jgi:anti-sigma B factor antagonist
MAATDLKVTLRRRGDVAVLELDGDIDRAAQGPLRDGYEQALTGAAGRVLLNFEQVRYINSTGIAVIVGLLARARKQRRPVAACGLSEHYQQIFSITRLSDFIDLYPDENSAIAGASPTATGSDVDATQGGGT